MTTTLEYGGGFLPNVRATLARSSNERVRPIIGLARSNRELSAALSRLDGYEATVAQIEALPAAVDSWTTGVPATNEAVAGVVVAALEGGDVAGVPEAVAAMQAKVNAVIEAVNAADRLASRLVTIRDGIIVGGADTLLAALDERMRETVAALAKNAATVRGIVTADDAIDAGVEKAWKARADLLKAGGHLRAAQAAVVRGLVPEVETALDDDGKRVAVLEVTDWRELDPRLPQTLRHGGLWVSDRHKGKPSERVEVWSLPWPADASARLEWLAVNHADVVGVPTVEAMTEGTRSLREAMVRATPTGGVAEPVQRQVEHLGNARVPARVR